MHSTVWHAWWREVRWPVCAFTPLAIVFALTNLDIHIANALFFDRTDLRWIGAHNFWIESVLHDGGRWTVRALVAAAGAVWVAASIDVRVRAWRRPAAYFVIAAVLSVGIVGLLKTITSVDCPWDLIPFNGRFPIVPLLAVRSSAPHTGHCFPAAHASSGYALVALYFAFRERNRKLARIGLTVGIACGVVFGLAQQARGAHFMSHDLWSAFLVWSTTAGVYVLGFAQRLHVSSNSGADSGALGLVRNRLDAIRRRDSGGSEARPRWNLS
jgi:membrane-associated PAP2 superfamily phosphatase